MLNTRSLSYGDVAETWQKFVCASHVLATDKTDYPIWRKGRNRYAAWIIPVTDTLVSGRLEKARKHLSEWLLQPWLCEPHVTILAGGFLASKMVYDDDLTPELIDRQSQIISENCKVPLELSAGDANSFLAAPFLEIECLDRHFHTLRESLLQVHGEPRSEDYLQHITIGLYRESYATDDIAKALSGLTFEPPIAFTANRIELVSFDVRDLTCSLQTEIRIELA
ncbi:MAG: 2'-5' RNA ligase [marine bacterium B5-7]|nr:MAG: 2'-5' RNA ligase [marine bacterium B5-7]